MARAKTLTPDEAAVVVNYELKAPIHNTDPRIAVGQAWRLYEKMAEYADTKAATGESIQDQIARHQAEGPMVGSCLNIHDQAKALFDIISHDPGKVAELAEALGEENPELLAKSLLEWQLKADRTGESTWSDLKDKLHRLHAWFSDRRGSTQG